MMFALAALMSLLALSACGHSPPTHLYTLDTVAPPQAPEHGDGPPVVVGKVTIPAALDRLSVVVRSGPDQLDIANNARWAAPPDGMTRRVLAEDLRQRLNPERVYLPGDPVPPGRVLTVRLDLLTFAGSRDGDVLLDGEWFVEDGPRHVLATRHAHLTRHVDGRDISAIVAAQSQLLGALSDNIATTLASPGQA